MPAEFLNSLSNTSAEVILSLAIILFAGFLMTRLTKKLRLPNVTGYILAGVLIGPYLLHLVPDSVIKGMDFITDLALAYIAFGVGEYFKLSQLKKNGKRVVIITCFEALTAAVLVTLCMRFVFHLSLPFALLLGAIGSATAPASTIMTIRQYHARGEIVDTILQVVALDDAVALLAFSICAVIVSNLESGAGAVGIGTVLVPLVLNVVTLALGVACGFLLRWIISDRRSREHRLVLINAVIMALTGVCSLLDISPLLPCMLMGTVYVNLNRNKKLFKQVNHFTPPIMLMFFVLSGMRLNVPALATAGIIGVAYFFVRIVGKYIGAYAGCRVGGSAPEVRRYLGMALVPQAGVSIGLAALAERMLPAGPGVMLSTIILSSSVLYEMVGPACAKASLYLSHAIKHEEPAGKEQKKAELPEKGEKPVKPDEKAVTDSAASGKEKKKDKAEKTVAVKGPKKAEPAADISTKPDIKKAQLQEDKEPENDAAVSSKAEKKHKEHKKKKPKAVNA